MIPIIVGVGDVKNRSTKIEDAREPADLMLEAINLAIQDAQFFSSSTAQEAFKSNIDSIDVVRTWTWEYPDLPGLLAERLGVRSPRHKYYPEGHGGNQPAKLLDEAALRVAKNESKVAVITGGEALASLSAFAKRGELPPPGWTKPARPIHEMFSLTAERLGKDDIGGRHSIGLPIHIYPLYENGFRAHRRQSIEENNRESSLLYGHFSQVAARNPNAWNYGSKPETAESISTVTKKNRMICLPYPLLMNAFNTVNLAAACIVTSTEYAKELGIPESRWIYLLSGAGSRESDHFWERPNYFHSPAISKALDQCLASAGLHAGDIDTFDFYSCFPIVPKLACHHLGLPIVNGAKPPTLLGGLTFFGGAGNNYSMHAITEMARQIRDGKARNGLILANGGVLSYQHAVCLSSRPRVDGSSYPDNRNHPSLETNGPVPQIEELAEGEAVIETYTVEFGRDGNPKRAFIIGRLVGNGHRFVANHGDQQTLARLASSKEEQIGAKGYVMPSTPAGSEGIRRNLFCFASKAGL